jgi:type I restriction enzyme S subunit
MKWKPYPKYKDSGVEWLRDVPEGWGSSAIKHRCLKITDGAHVSPETDGGVFPFVSTVDLRRSGIDFENCLLTTAESYTMMACGGCKPELGDILFSKDGTIGKTVAVEDPREFVVASSLIIVRPNQRLVKPYFLNYLFQVDFVAAQVDRFVKGTALRRLSIQNLLFVKGLFPPIDEQLQITEFLDRQTRKIDTLIAKQKRLIELLQEKRQSLISHAVTKGLNPNVPMKPSGVELVGEVPAHWDVTPLKRQAQRIDVGIAEAATHAYVAEQEQDSVPILRSTNVRANAINGELFFISGGFAVSRPSKRLRANDIVTVRTGNAGVSAVVPAHLDGCHCFTLLMTTPASTLDPTFGSYFLNSSPAQAYFSVEGWGAAQANISVPILAETQLPVPPLAEQREIVAHITSASASLRELTDKANAAIALMREHRTALISAAVTGKIDVRESSHA